MEWILFFSSLRRWTDHTKVWSSQLPKQQPTRKWLMYLWWLWIPWHDFAAKDRFPFKNSKNIESNSTNVQSKQHFFRSSTKMIWIWTLTGTEIFFLFENQVRGHQYGTSNTRSEDTRNGCHERILRNLRLQSRHAENFECVGQSLLHLRHRTCADTDRRTHIRNDEEGTQQNTKK